MHSLNMWWRKKPKTFLTLFSLFVSFLLAFPLIKYGKPAAFFSIDPDVVYVANALSYAKWKIMGYYDHPGIPSIYIINIFLLPLRLVAKLYIKKDFIDFVFQNYDHVFLYLRLVQSLLFTGSLFIYLSAVYKLTKKYSTVLFAVFSLLVFTPVYYLSLSISAETFNFFLVSIWLYIFSLFIVKKQSMFIYALSVISGLLFANRATNIAFIIATFLFFGFTKKGFLKNIFFLTLGFFVGTLSSSASLIAILKRLLFFAGSSGVHGEGAGNLININNYIESVLIYLNRDSSLLILFILFILAAVFYSHLLKSLWKGKIYLVALFMLVVITFMKFPLAHYQTANFQYIVFTLSIVFSKIEKWFKTVILITLLLLCVENLRSYYKIIGKEMKEVSVMENYIKNNPSKIGTMWEWARTKEFAYLWTNSWGGGIFNEQLESRRPAVYQWDNNIFEKCWDKLYIQEGRLNNFMKNNIDKELGIKKISGSQELYEISSNHCLATMP